MDRTLSDRVPRCKQNWASTPYAAEKPLC